MASAFYSNLRRLLCASVLACAPQAGFADLSAVDLSALRAALRAAQVELSGNVTQPVDVAALWEKLPIDKTPTAEVTTATPVAMAPVASASVVAKTPANAPAPKPQTAARSVLTPAVPAPATQASTNGLFSIQLSQTTTPQPAIAPLPAPTFDPSPGFQAKTPVVLPSASAQVAPLKVVASNFRLMLAPLSQTYTGRNSMAVVNAQGPRGPIAISLRSGSFTLADIQAHAAALGMPSRADGTLTAPIVIWPEATLHLAPGERLALARDAGAFVLSMGTLDINGALIEVVGPENPHTPSFVPFVTIAGGGSLSVDNATFRGLGFGQTAKFSGLSVAGSLLTQNKGTVEIRNSLFDGIKRVTIAGSVGAKITGNTFVNPGDATVHLINAAHVEIDNNLFVDGSHTNAIRIEMGSIHAHVTRNIFLGGQRVALMIAGRSDHVEVRDNVIWKRQGAGIKFLKTRCGLVENNIVLDNLQKGVEVRKSDGLVVKANLIAGNGNAGIWVSAQTPEAQTEINANVLVANGSGLSAATGAEIFLRSNNFSRQLPKLLEGDIARLSRGLVVDLTGKEPLRFDRGNADRTALNSPLCGSGS